MGGNILVYVKLLKAEKHTGPFEILLDLISNKKEVVNSYLKSYIEPSQSVRDISKVFSWRFNTERMIAIEPLSGGLYLRSGNINLAYPYVPTVNIIRCKEERELSMIVPIDALPPPWKLPIVLIDWKKAEEYIDYIHYQYDKDLYRDIVSLLKFMRNLNEPYLIYIY